MHTTACLLGLEQRGTAAEMHVMGIKAPSRGVGLILLRPVNGKAQDAVHSGHLQPLIMKLMQIV